MVDFLKLGKGYYLNLAQIASVHVVKTVDQKLVHVEIVFVGGSKLTLFEVVAEEFIKFMSVTGGTNDTPA
jgi:hypothetical protein